LDDTEQGDAIVDEGVDFESLAVEERLVAAASVEAKEVDGGREDVVAFDFIDEFVA
jgi:hypothetical protein